MGARRTREAWSGLVDEFEASGESMQRFCAKHRVQVGRLKWWRWRLRSERSSTGPAKPVVRLLPVDVVEVAPHPPTSLVVAISGVELRVEVGTDVGYVGALVSALCSRC
jgi:hypothetical protein